MTDTMRQNDQDDWYVEHFDHLSPKIRERFDETLGEMRERCPVAHSDVHGGFWVATTYDEVLQIVQNWETFSSAHGLTIPHTGSSVPLLPMELDPPLHRAFRKVINLYLSPAAVAPYEEPTRRIVTELIDGFVEDGQCDFVEEFAEKLPRVSFFQLVMHAPTADIPRLSELTTIADGLPDHPRFAEAWVEIRQWIQDFVADRRARRQAGRGADDDIIEAVIHMDIDGRPINDDEILGTIQVLLFGGFGTTAAALGNAMYRFTQNPGLPATLRDRPELIPNAIEELLRLDSPVVCLGRGVTRDVELGGQTLAAGDRVLFHLASADRDASQFERPEDIDIERQANRHLAFGGGPHRCAGSNLARMNLRVSFDELTARLDDIRLQDPTQAVPYRTVFTRGPSELQIAFTPGAKVG